MGLSQLHRDGTWTTPPAGQVLHLNGELHVTSVKGSDAWRHTSYGFLHDNEHALLEPLPRESAIEVTFLLDFSEQFDQAGLFLRADETEWIKAGVEVSDGVAQVSAVVTHNNSDWSVSPAPHWMGRHVTIRASRSNDAVTLRARVDDNPFHLVRLAYLHPGLDLAGGIFCASPSRSGLTVRFIDYRQTPPDIALH